MLLGRENNTKEFQELEANRIRFREYCRIVYNTEFTIEDLHKLLESHKWENDGRFLEMFHKEPILQRYYLSHIKNEPIELITKTWGEG